MSAQPATEILFHCDGADVPADLAQHYAGQIRTLTSIGEDGETNLQLDTLTAKLGHQVPPRAQDLLYIATYCVGADQEVNRGSGNLDVHRERWRRHLTMCIPVADPQFWNTEEIRDALSRTLHFATEDRWTFVFSPQRRTGNMQLRINALDDRELLGSPDTVVLFSGGTDSLCATVDAIADRGLRPIIASHRAASNIHGWQTELLAHVRMAFPTTPLHHMSFTMHRKGRGDADPSQRTRAFLFAVLGSAIAATLGIERVVLADNGYVSINPPISGELAGTLASRGTHPKLLRLMTSLNTMVFEQSVRLENPFALKTRAEALETLTRQGLAPLIRQTHSCGKHRGPGRTREVPHCGGCSQCVDRRVAILAAGLEEEDPVSTYGLDIFTEELTVPEARKIALSYLQFAADTHNVDDEDLVEKYVELLACVDPEAPDAPLAVSNLAGVLRRHAGEVLTVVEQQIARNSAALARGELPVTGLLRLYLGPHGEPSAIRPDDRQQVPSDNGGRLLDRCEVQFSGTLCHITFGAEKATVHAYKGMHQLARLLKAPGQELTALDLVAGTSPSGAPAVHIVEAQLSTAERHADDPILDDAAVKSYQKRAGELGQALKADITPAQREQILDELEEIARELRIHRGKGGKLRNHKDPAERARVAVTKNITKVRKEIEGALPSLHRHLETYLHLGHVCRYEPQPPLIWAIAA